MRFTWCNVIYVGEPDVDFLKWLGSTVAHASKTAEEHRVLCAATQALTDSMETQFKLSRVLVSSMTFTWPVCNGINLVTITLNRNRSHVAQICSKQDALSMSQLYVCGWLKVDLMLMSNADVKC